MGSIVSIAFFNFFGLYFDARFWHAAWRATAAFQHVLIASGLTCQASTVGSIVSIAFFNFFGLSVTKSLSGAARAAIDACRTILIWLFSVQIGWERFHGLQVSSPCSELQLDNRLFPSLQTLLWLAML